MRLRLFLLSLFGVAAVAQPITVGVRGGVPLTDFFKSVNNQTLNTTSDRYIVGPTVELRLPLGFGIEADALYRHLSYANYSASIASGTSLVPLGSATESASANSWEFPVLAKYRLPFPIVRPYVDAGIAFNKLTGLKNTFLNTSGIANAPATTQTGKGFVFGAGVDFHVKVHIMPEIRYTHWGETRFLDALGQVAGSQNQAEFLVGITF
jgi:opacity protein-like surface antigen